MFGFTSCVFFYGLYIPDLGNKHQVARLKERKLPCCRKVFQHMAAARSLTSMIVVRMTNHRRTQRPKEVALKFVVVRGPLPLPVYSPGPSSPGPHLTKVDSLCGLLLRCNQALWTPTLRLRLRVCRAGRGWRPGERWLGEYNQNCIIVTGARAVSQSRTHASELLSPIEGGRLQP